MTQQLVGYQLIAKDGAVHNQWGGTPGQLPGVPNPLNLPSGLCQVHCASVGADYEDFDGAVYSLQPWMIDVPDVAPTPSIEDRLSVLEGRTDKIATALVDKQVVTSSEIAVDDTAVADVKQP